MGLVNSLLSRFFLSEYHAIPRGKSFWPIWGMFLQQIYYLKLFTMVAVSIGLCFVCVQKQVMLANNECYSWYKNISNFWSFWNWRKKFGLMWDQTVIFAPNSVLLFKIHTVQFKEFSVLVQNSYGTVHTVSSKHIATFWPNPQNDDGRFVYELKFS